MSLIVTKSQSTGQKRGSFRGQSHAFTKCYLGTPCVLNLHTAKLHMRRDSLGLREQVGLLCVYRTSNLQMGHLRLCLPNHSKIQLRWYPCLQGRLTTVSSSSSSHWQMLHFYKRTQSQRMRRLPMAFSHCVNSSKCAMGFKASRSST